MGEYRYNDDVVDAQNDLKGGQRYETYPDLRIENPFHVFPLRKNLDSSNNSSINALQRHR
jgi:hypothetical protein